MSAARRKGQRGQSRLRAMLPGIVAVGVVGAIALVLTRIDFGDAIKEITLPLRHDDIIRQESRDEDIAQTLDQGDISLPEVDPALLAAVIYAESRFVDQTSHAGARGLMQITPETADTIEKLSGGSTFVFDDLADPELNIRYGSFFLRYLLHVYEGNEVAALAAYNSGPGNVDEWGGAGLARDDIAFPETAAYVDEVLEKRDEYRKNYADELGL